MEDSPHPLHLDPQIVRYLLDFHTDVTQAPVALYQEKTKQLLWSQKEFFSPLCAYLTADDEHLAKVCERDHLRRCRDPKGEPEVCHLGLWNVSLPIHVNGILVGALLTGQRRLVEPGPDSISREAFKGFLERVSRQRRGLLSTLFAETPVVSSEMFDDRLVKTLSGIHTYIATLLKVSTDHDTRRRSRVQNIAHEFLLPIQSIVANAENLYSEVSDPELKSIAEDVMQEMQKLSFLAENMRNSLIPSEGDTYYFEKKSIRDCIDMPIHLYQKEANTKGITIKGLIALGGNVPVIEMAFEELQRAFANVIHNAVKYSYSTSGASAKRYVSVYGRMGSDLYEISVTNYGIGILPEEIATGQIFEDGYRGRLSADRNRTGSGMGLSEVKRIVERHSGRVEIESTPQGGPYTTTVRVYLPYTQPSREDEGDAGG